MNSIVSEYRPWRVFATFFSILTYKMYTYISKLFTPFPLCPRSRVHFQSQKGINLFLPKWKIYPSFRQLRKRRVTCVILWFFDNRMTCCHCGKLPWAWPTTKTNDIPAVRDRLVETCSESCSLLISQPTTPPYSLNWVVLVLCKEGSGIQTPHFVFK